MQVLAAVYIRKCLPYLNLAALHSVKSVLSMENWDHNDAVMADVEEKLLNLTSALHCSKSVSPSAPSSSWRPQILTLLQESIYPDEISWMVGDDGMDDQSYSQRAVLDLEGHFRRCFSFTLTTRSETDFLISKSLIATSVTFRTSLADKVANLCCALAHCDSSDCWSSRHTVNLTLIPGILPIAGRLLDVSEGDVSSAVRRRVYTVLTRAIRHHSLDAGLEGLEDATNVIFQGLTDKDRSVRLCAG